MSTCSARCGDSHGNAFCACFDGNVAGDHIRDRHRHHQRRYSGNTAFDRFLRLGFQRHDSADSRASDDAESVRIDIFAGFQTAVFHRLSDGYDRILRREIESLASSLVREHEILYFRAHARLVSFCVKMCDLSDSVLFVADSFPEIVTVISHRAYDTHTGDDYSFFCHCYILLLNQVVI